METNGTIFFFHYWNLIFLSVLVVNWANLCFWLISICSLTLLCVYVGVTDQSGIVWTPLAVCSFESPLLYFLVYGVFTCLWSAGCQSWLKLVLTPNKFCFGWATFIILPTDAPMLFHPFYLHMHMNAPTENSLPVPIIPSALVTVSVSGLVLVAVGAF